MIDLEVLEEFKQEICDRYSPTEIAELLIEYFELSEREVLDLFSDDMIMEFKFR